MTEGASFKLSRPLRAVAPFVSWIAVAVSTLLLGLLLALLAPRALDRTAEAGRGAPWASAGWGVALAVGLPVLAVFAVASVLGIPLGIGLVLSFLPAALFGVVVTAQTLGRAMIDPDRRRVTAFLAGWLLQTVIGVDPVRERRGVHAGGDVRPGRDGGRRVAGAWATPRGPAGREAPRGRGLRRPDGERHTGRDRRRSDRERHAGTARGSRSSRPLAHPAPRA